MKKSLITLLTTLMLMTIPYIASAHTFVGGHEEEIKKILNLIEAKLGPLNEELTFYSEETREAGYKRLVELGVKPEIAKELSKISVGLTMPNINDKWVIIINENYNSKFFFTFAICHELIHRYQVNKYHPTLFLDRNFIEGEANIIAAQLLNVEIQAEKNQKELDKFNASQPYEPFKLLLAQHYYAYKYCEDNKNTLYYQLNHK